MRNFFLSVLFVFLIDIRAETITIDGVLDEPEWANAFIIDQFYQTMILLLAINQTNSYH